MPCNVSFTQDKWVSTSCDGRGN
uniref:Uncharacterized protein n=1 Tax=Arundo donax TaxID=35708 RepID=A0A0A9B2P9_ARUDO